MRRLVIAGLLGLGLGAVVVLAFALPYIRSQRQQATAGWEPVKRLVFTRDLPERELVRESDLATRDVPSQFVTGSHVSLEDASRLVGTRIERPVQAGDPVLWQDFVDQRPEQVRACIEKVRPDFERARAEARAAVGSRVRAGLSTRATLPTLTAPVAEVLVLSEELPAGSTIEAKHLQLARAPAALLSAGVVEGAALPELVGARLLIPVMPGDILRWQFIDRADAPQTAPGCLAELDAEVARHGGRAARDGAREFADGSNR